jgi:hypothetical protein
LFCISINLREVDRRRATTLEKRRSSGLATVTKVSVVPEGGGIVVVSMSLAQVVFMNKWIRLLLSLLSVPTRGFHVSQINCIASQFCRERVKMVEGRDYDNSEP